MWLPLLMLALAEIGFAQPQRGPITLVATVDNVSISSPRIISITESLSVVLWVQDSAGYDRVLAAELDLTNLQLGAPEEIARTVPPAHYKIEAASGDLDWAVVITQQHPTSFDLFCIESQDGTLDSLFFTSESYVFEPGWGWLEHTPEEVSIIPHYDGWLITWATSRVVPTWHESFSSSSLARIWEDDTIVVLSFGEEVWSYRYSNPFVLAQSPDTFVAYSPVGTGDQLFLGAYTIDSGSPNSTRVLWERIDSCASEVRSNFVTPSGILRVLSTSDEVPLYLVDYWEGCDTLAQIDLTSSLDVVTSHWAWGFAGLTVSPDSLRLHRIDSYGDLMNAGRPMCLSAEGFRISDAQLMNRGSGYIESVWVERETQMPHTNRLNWTAVYWQDPLDAESPPPALPTSLSLSAFPNPFNSSVKIEYEIAKAGEIELSVFNTLGQKVETLFEGHASSGRHDATWSPSGSSGVYFVKLVADGIQKSHKILYLR